MEVVSFSNLGSSETKKTGRACNFQAMTMVFFVYATWFDERPNKKLCMYTNMKLFVVL